MKPSYFSSATFSVCFTGLSLAAIAGEKWEVVDHFQPNMDGLYMVSGNARPQGANAWYEPEIDRVTRGNWYVRENYLASRYRIPFRPINPNLVFKTPPVGWMTWYAVKFRASDAVVMHNARRFMEKFRGYTDEKPVLWVDWEWFHGRFSENGDETDTDMLTPRKDVYPRGMKPVADDLKALGFTPALWVSVLNDTRTNALWKAHPEWVIGDRKAWCGPIYANPCAPGFCEEFVPQLFSLYKEWGYEAFKWDVVPASYFMISDRKAHGLDVEPPREAFRRCVKAVRKAVGENCYVMSCSGEWEEPTVAAIDLFDGGRIGGDIFTWEEFRRTGVDRILSYQPFHNTVFWADADNLVLREEFSTLAQARTRVSIYALAGVPITMGDEIDALDAPRIDLLRRAMPVVKMRPASLSRGAPSQDLLASRVDFGRDFGSWQVRAWSNLTTNRTLSTTYVAKNAAVWDFWNDRLVGADADKVVADVFVRPGDTVLYRVTPLEKNRPTLVSVSRHITQGGYELKSYAADEKGAQGVVKCPGGETVKVSFVLPEGMIVKSASHPVTQVGKVVRLSLTSIACEDVAFELECARGTPAPAAAVAAAVEQAYAELWGRFVSPQGILYDYVGELPTPKDCSEARPNAMGWWSPIENGPMFTGPFLKAMLLRAKRTKSAEDLARCLKLVEGLLLCAEVCETPGMICRGVGTDGHCHYPLGSGDQTLPWFYGLDAFVQSGLGEPALLKRVIARMSEVGEALEKNGWGCPSDGAFKGQSRGHLDSDGLPFRGATHYLMILRALADATGLEKWKKAYVTARDEKYPGGYDVTRLDVCAYGYRFDKEKSKRPFEMESFQFWIYVCAEGCLAELAAREEDPVAAVRYREGLEKGADWAQTFMKERTAYRNDYERPYRFANWRTGYLWRPQRTQKEADEVAQLKSKDILGNRHDHERRKMTSPLAAAAICAYAGEYAEKYAEEINRTLTHYDYSTPGVSEFFFALLAYETMQGTCMQK